MRQEKLRVVFGTLTSNSSYRREAFPGYLQSAVLLPQPPFYLTSGKPNFKPPNGHDLACCSSTAAEGGEPTCNPQRATTQRHEIERKINTFNECCLLPLCSLEPCSDHTRSHYSHAAAVSVRPPTLPGFIKTQADAPTGNAAPAGCAWKNTSSNRNTE